MHGLLLFCALQRVMRFRRHSGCRDMSNEELGGIRFSSPAPSLPNSGYFCLEASPAHSLSSVKEMQTLFFQCPNNSSQNLLNDNQARKNIGFIKLTAFNISASMLRACLGCQIWLKFKQTLTLAFRQVLVLIIMLHGGRGHNYRGGGKCILMWLFRTSLSTLTRPSTTALLNALNFKWCLIIKQNI